MSSNVHVRRRRLARGARYVAMALTSVIFLVPVLWMLSGSLKSSGEVLAFPPRWIPETFRFSNYIEVFVQQPFARQFLNSIVVMVCVVAITIVISTAAGYALARSRLPGGPILLVIILSGIFIPSEATILPLYNLAASWGWLDTLAPLVVFTSFTTTGAIATFVMRQAFLILPAEFEEAARVDGASRFRVLVQVLLPIVTPSIAAVGVLSAWHSWNQYLEPLVYLRSSELLTVPIALAQFVNPYTGPQLNIQLAATTLSVVPVLVLFMFAQRHVVAGLTAGGLKG